MRLECRECDVICERVVNPWQCLKSNCEYVYSYEDSDTMYFGCLYKVFAAEFDMTVFSEGPTQSGKPLKVHDETSATTRADLARRGGGRRRSLKTTDPYGPVRMTRPPRPQCKTQVEQAYDSFSGGCGCCNPTFFHHPFGAGDDAIKLTAMPPGDDVALEG